MTSNDKPRRPMESDFPKPPRRFVSSIFPLLPSHWRGIIRSGVAMPPRLTSNREVQMRYGHFTSGGRYPVLRALAILYLVGAVGLFIYGIWKAFDTLLHAYDSAEGKVVVAVGWIAGGFLASLLAVGFGELIK